MKAERDLGFGPKTRTSSMRASRESDASPRRGEREATLVRRRRVQKVRRIAVPAVIGVIACAALIGWWSGAIADMVGSVSKQINTQAIKTGLVIDEVAVSGLRRLSRADILEAVAVPPGTPIFAVDIDEICNRVAMIGWVKSVEVARELPNHLRVQITERKPIAIWQQQGLLALIDDEGAVITTAGLDEFSDLPQVVGVGAARAAARLAPILRTEPSLYRDMQAAVRVADRRWDVVFKNGVRVRLPDGGEAQAWRRLAQLQAEHRILAREIQIVDLRQPDRLILRLTSEEVNRRKLEAAAGVKGGRV